MQQPLSCPVCSDDTLARILSWRGEEDGTIAFRCSKGHVFIVRKTDLEEAPHPN